MTPEPRETATQPRSVTPERFARVRVIFEAAVERPASERRAFVAGACVGDAAMQREVEAMLAADQPESRPSSSAPEEGRFPAGTVLAGRYRILGLLGHGGMGEVYKAFDLILNQTVALKFLAPGQISEAALARFRNEVRIARQVSHPNVCRVHDLGMVEGLHFLSMEYIDGEDLASLLRRIGRLPQDKAIEFTRKICAGLSAAHERGVLHRDLKPANIMIDGRGQVRITDFGLAGLAAEIPLSDLRSGTPAYMSPEQKAGREVTTRSDIYALGLVLHEMFTGKTRHETQSSPSELVKELDPTIERLILRCVEEDPKRRPQTPLNVAMALPGADPIAAALAAGETPSPEMVAASSEKEGLSLKTAAICFGAALVLLFAGIAIEGKYGFLAHAPLSIPPDGLADRAQQLLKSLGYTDQSGTVEYGFFSYDRDVAENVNRYPSARRGEILSSHQPPIVGFYYRLGPTATQSSSTALPTNRFPDDTDLSRNLLSGIHLILNADGKLIRLEAQPLARSTPNGPVDWDVLFAAAGLDPARFRPSAPVEIPSMATDARFAWTGTYAENRSERVRVVAASWQGRPVVFDVQVFLAPSSQAPVSIAVRVAGTILLLLAGGVTAWRNLRLGRGDKRGAAVIAGGSLLFGIGAAVLGPSHTENPAQNLPFGLAFSSCLFLAALVWVAYIAIEPFVRRHWPDSLISWTRFSAGRLKNTLVASHILVGILGAEAFFWGSRPVQLFAMYGTNGTALRPGIAFMGSASSAIGFWLELCQYGLALGMVLLLGVVLLRLLLRRVWIADTAAAALLALLAGAASSTGWSAIVATAFYTLTSLIWMWILRRFGFLPMMTVFFFGIQAAAFPVATTGWFAGRSLTEHFVPVFVAAWALWVIVSSQWRLSSESTA